MFTAWLTKGLRSAPGTRSWQVLSFLLVNGYARAASVTGFYHGSGGKVIYAHGSATIKYHGETLRQRFIS